MNDNLNGECLVIGNMPTSNEEKPESDTTPKRLSGIYGLQNKLKPDKWYVGQSIDIQNRWKKNYSTAKCKFQRKLYNALLKYGYENFNKVVLEELENPTQKLLDDREGYWMKHYNCIENGYNLRGGGNGHGWHSEETKEKIRIARAKQIIGRNHVSDEAKTKMSMERKGKPLSKETCIKLSISHIGNRHTEKSKREISKTMAGRPSLRKGKSMPIGFGEKISKIMIGKKRGPYKPRNITNDKN